MLTSGWEVLLAALFASFAAGLGTSVGALGVFFAGSLSSRAENLLLSGAAGIMLAAAFFSLLAPALEIASAQLPHASLAALLVIAGLLAGGFGLNALHKRIPHEHFHTGPEGPPAEHVRRIWLFVIAITLHNFPEGMAVGVGFAQGEWSAGLPLAIGIGLQNIPEGLTVAIALVSAGYTRTLAFLVASLTGLVEPVGGLVGGSAVWLAELLLAPVMAMAAGAMLFIISDEIIPETHRAGFQQLATLSLMIGFSMMLLLDAVLA